MIAKIWHGKPYYSLDAYCKNTFHHKCYKIALNAHMTCPNRDGTLGTRGCIFCSSGGSGEFAVSSFTPGTDHTALTSNDIQAQLQEGLQLFGDKHVGDHFIAYFQAYTNTYAPLPYLQQVYTQALSCPDVCGISIATRPDCLAEETLALLTALKKQFPHKFIWIELGLQTMHPETAHYIRRGYSLHVFEEALLKLHTLDFPVITHVILGLPGESNEMQLETIHYLNSKRIFGIKLQLLHILKNTDLALEYANGQVPTLTKEAYLDLLIQCIEHLSPDIVIHRVTGDGPKESLIAPLWSLNKRDVLNSLHKRMRETNSFQGKYFVH